MPPANSWRQQGLPVAVYQCNKSSICLTAALHHYPAPPPPYCVCLDCWQLRHRPAPAATFRHQSGSDVTSAGAPRRAHTFIIACQQARIWADPLHGWQGEALASSQGQSQTKVILDFSFKSIQNVICCCWLVGFISCVVVLLLCRGFPDGECLWNISSFGLDAKARLRLLY